MSNIEIKIESFGAIERQLPHGLMLQCVASTRIADVLVQIEQLYPRTAKMLQRCACAIDEDIVSRQTLLNQSLTLVLLSPVAGG